MPRFFFSYTSRNKTIRGSCQAADRKQVESWLKRTQRGKFRLREENLWDKIKAQFEFLQLTSNRLETSRFLRQLELCFKSGLPLADSLDTIWRGQWSPSMTASLQVLTQGLHSGHSLSSLVALLPQHFPNSAVGLIRTGEESGNLAHALGSSAELLERQARITKKVTSALVYPLFVLGLFGLLMAIMTIWIAPAFADVFSSMGVQVPALLRACAFIKSGLTNPIAFLLHLEVFILLVVMLVFWTKTPEGSKFLGDIVLRVPEISNMVIYADLSRFLNCLSVSIDAGIPVIRALKISNESVVNPLLRRDFESLEIALANGRAMSEQVTEWSWSPRDLSLMLEVAEQTGSMVKTLNIARKVYEEDLEHRINRCVALLEPFIMGAMGLFVGVFLIGMMSPLMRILQQI